MDLHTYDMNILPTKHILLINQTHQNKHTWKSKEKIVKSRKAQTEMSAEPPVWHFPDLLRGGQKVKFERK